MLDTLVRHSYLTLLLDTSSGTLLLDTVVGHCFLDTLVGHSYLTPLPDTLTWHSSRTLWLDTLAWHSCRTLSHADTASADAKISAVPQITHTDTASADAKIFAVPQITHTDTASANAKITAATRVHLTHFCDAFRQHSPLWRALRRHRKRLRTVADGCGRKRNFWRTQPHPQTPKWNGNPRYALGKNIQHKHHFYTYCTFTVLDKNLWPVSPRPACTAPHWVLLRNAILVHRGLTSWHVQPCEVSLGETCFILGMNMKQQHHMWLSISNEVYISSPNTWIVQNFRQQITTIQSIIKLNMTLPNHYLISYLVILFPTLL